MPHTRPDVSWLESVVARRRATGAYSDEELAQYRLELAARWGIQLPAEEEKA
jgi:hypothetical protein